MTRILSSVVGVACLGVILLLSACGSAAETTPTPNMVATATSMPPPIASLLDQELLGAPGITSTCDQPPEAQLTCATDGAKPVLTVEVNASTYARWSLRFDAIDTALTGDETLLIKAHHRGTLAPNLYLVERTGRRVAVSLAHYGLQAGDNTLAIPLREIRDEKNEWPVFADVREIQLVFEWADMAGILTLRSMQFRSVWQESVQLEESSEEVAKTLTPTPGFVVAPIADQLPAVTQLTFDPQGDLWASLQNGRIWHYRDQTGDGFYDERLLYATGF